MTKIKNQSFSSVPTTFGDLLIESKDGEWGSGEATQGADLSYIIRGTDFDKLYYQNHMLPERWIKHSAISRKKLESGDIIIETAGGTSTQSTGRTVLLKKSFFKSHADKHVLCSSFARFLRLDQLKTDPAFLYYYLQILYKNGYMGVFNTQHTGVSRFQFTTFKNKTKIALPSLPIQKKIASILSAYDDLVENNNRRITILEKMAEELYREWFVRMRFPGHEKVKVIKGVPEGWKVVKLRDIVHRKSFGRIYRESELSEQGTVVVIDQSTKDYLGFYDGIAEHQASFENPIILFGDHSCKMQLMIKPFSLAENVIPFSSQNGIPVFFLFYLVHNKIETIEYKRHWTELITKEVWLPKAELQESFSLLVNKFVLQKENLNLATHKIVTIRDRLLSRLMSGKLNVEKLDIRFPKSMSEAEEMEEVSA